MTGFLLMAEVSSLLELSGRATIVLGVALALAWLIRKGSATARHHLWTLTFALLLALPVLTLAGPSWNVPLLPYSDPSGDEVLAESVVAPARAELAAPAGGAAFPADLDAAVLATVEASSPRRSVALPLLIWAIGCGAALVSIGVGILRFQTLVRSSELVDDPVWHRQLEAVQNELGFRRDVRLLLGEEVVAPMTGGLWSPTILFPASASGWSAARRAVVLTHELVHVRRRDVLRQLVGRVVLALYWFHPLSWVASRLAAASREEACDEEVLAVGPRPSEYARHLLALGGGMNRGQAVLSLPMVHPSQLERRIMAIVRSNRPRRNGLATALILTMLGAAAVTASVANPIPAKTARVAAAQPNAADFVREDCSFTSAENWVGKRSLTDAVLCIGVNGDAAMSDDGLEVLAISAGGSVELESSGRRRHRLVITQGADGLEHDWRIDGQEHAFDDEARQWRDLMLVLLRDGFPGLWERGFGQDAGLRRRAGRGWTEVAGVLGQLDLEAIAPELHALTALKAELRPEERKRFIEGEVEALRRLINP